MTEALIMATNLHPCDPDMPPVCILGGSGFVGLHICNRLAQRGVPVRVITRKREAHPDLLLIPGITAVEGDVFDRRFLEQQFIGCRTVINLIGILNEKGHNGEGFRRVHAELPRMVVEASRNTGVSRLLHMSALNADASNGPSHYLRSKGEGENIVHTYASERLHVTSFQPSVIFGAEDSFFNRFATLLKMTPLAFPLACPQSRFAPVYVGDVADAFINAIDDKSTYGQRIPLCGPGEYSLRELVSYTAQQLGLRRWIIGLPDSLSKLQAAIFEWLPGRPFSLDNYRSLQVDSVCHQHEPMPTRIEAVVPSYIGRQNIHYEYNCYRKHQRVKRPRRLNKKP